MKKPPTSSVIGPGDTLVYADGRSVHVVNLLWLNGQRGIQLDDPSALFFRDRFKPLSVVEKYISIGLWKVQRTTGKR